MLDREAILFDICVKQKSRFENYLVAFCLLVAKLLGTGEGQTNDPTALFFITVVVLFECVTLEDPILHIVLVLLVES